MLRLREDVPLFPGGRKKCLTLSFDDGTVEDLKITQMLRDRGLAATFNLNPGLFGHDDHLDCRPVLECQHTKLTADRIAATYEGFEIACHGLTHAHLGRVPSSMAAYEIAECKKRLEDIVHEPVRGMAWPIRYRDPDVARERETARACGICYARTTTRSYGYVGFPEDFLHWDAACSYVEPQLAELTEGFLKPVEDKAYVEPLLYYVWGHGYEATGRNAWGTLEGFLDQVAGREDEIWYASNIEVYDYIQAVRGLVYSATGDYIYNPSRIDVWMAIDHAAYRIPSGETITIPDPSK